MPAHQQISWLLVTNADADSVGLAGPSIPHFSAVSSGCQGHWSADHILSSEGLNFGNTGKALINCTSKEDYLGKPLIGGENCTG